jgi:hypothetical protein
MEVYSEIVKRIIKEQEAIIGPVAVEQAMHIPNLHVEWDKHKVTVKADGPKVVDKLVKQYKSLFGKISVEVCREAAEPLMDKLPKDRLPKTLA